MPRSTSPLKLRNPLLGRMRVDRAPRSTVFLFGILISADATTHVRLRNISEGGAMVETTKRPPRKGSRIAFCRHAHRIEGHVAWVCGRRVGLCFDEPLDRDHRFRLIDEMMEWFVPVRAVANPIA